MIITPSCVILSPQTMAAQLENLQASLGAQTAAVMRQHSSLEEARSHAQESEERMKMTVR